MRPARILLALALGAATSLALCIAPALVLPEPQVSGSMIPYYTRGRLDVWAGFRSHSWAHTQYIAWPHSGVRDGTLDERWSRASKDGDPLNVSPRRFPQSALRAAEASAKADRSARGFSVVAHGWPFRMLSYHELWSGSPVMDTFLRREHAINPSLRPDPLTYPKAGTRFLGTRPILPGLLANLAIFSAAWLVLFSGPRALTALRRSRRLRRNHCPRCNYDLRGLTACPECGWNCPLPN